MPLNSPYKDAVMSGVVTLLAKWAIGFCTSIGILLLYMVFGERPFGIQLVTLIAYTIVVFFNLFCNTRFLRGFDFYSEARQKSTSRLLIIHVSFLILVFAIQTMVFKFGPKLPHWWIDEKGPKDDSPLQIALCIAVFSLGVIQVVWSRRILSRAEKENYLA